MITEVVLQPDKSVIMNQSAHTATPGYTDSRYF